MIGVIVGALFGAAWGLAGSAALGRPARSRASIACIAISLFIIIVAILTRATGWQPRHAFRLDTYLVAVAAEGLLIPLAIILLRRAGRDYAVVPACAIIVAVHFLGLWQATGSPAFARLSLGLAAPPMAALAIAERDPRQAQVTTGLGSAAVLFLASASGLIA